LEIDRAKGENIMDMRKFGGGAIRPDDLRDGPRVERIVEITENETHGCAVLHFESGDSLFCWNTIARVLNRAWGFDSDDWIGQEVELSLGTYRDKKTDTDKEQIVVRAVSPPKSKSVPAKHDMDDDIPF
jgi:hypothetical protein